MCVRWATAMVLTAFLIGCVAGAAIDAVPPANAAGDGQVDPAAVRYEYFFAKVKPGMTEKQILQRQQALANEAGREGWELVQVELSYLYFKRPMR